MNLLWLGGAVGTGAGDEAGSADYKPRDVAYEIFADQMQQLDDAKVAVRAARRDDIPTFNKKMTGKIPLIMTAGASRGGGQSRGVFEQARRAQAQGPSATRSCILRLRPWALGLGPVGPQESPQCVDDALRASS